MEVGLNLSVKSNYELANESVYRQLVRSLRYLTSKRARAKLEFHSQLYLQIYDTALKAKHWDNYQNTFKVCERYLEVWNQIWKGADFQLKQRFKLGKFSG